jgi:hypothetical protein
LSSNSTDTLTVKSGYKLIPEATDTQDLGSSTHRFKTLYLSSATIDLGGTQISAGADNTVSFIGSGGAPAPIAASAVNFGTPTNAVSMSIDPVTNGIVITSATGTTAAGYTGSQGYTGSRGLTGYIGSIGSIGYSGSRGEIGYSGSIGGTGYVGSQGQAPESTTYLANTITMPDPTKGTYNSGTVTSIRTFGDYPTGNYYSVNDTATQPGFIVDVGFTNVLQFNRINMSLAYQVTSGHVVYVEMYNYATSNWEIFYQYSGLTNWAQFTIGVIDSTNFISNGNVTVRIYHDSYGNTSHETKFDYIALEDSLQGGMGPKGD